MYLIFHALQGRGVRKKLFSCVTARGAAPARGVGAVGSDVTAEEGALSDDSRLRQEGSARASGPSQALFGTVLQYQSE